MTIDQRGARNGNSTRRPNDRIGHAALGMDELASEGLEGGTATGAAVTVTWKTVWMGLMVCCAVRQLLSCIQVSQSNGGGSWWLVVGGLSNGHRSLSVHLATLAVRRPGRSHKVFHQPRRRCLHQCTKRGAPREVLGVSTMGFAASKPAALPLPRTIVDAPFHRARCIGHGSVSPPPPLSFPT